VSGAPNYRHFIRKRGARQFFDAALNRFFAFFCDLNRTARFFYLFIKNAARSAAQFRRDSDRAATNFPLFSAINAAGNFFGQQTKNNAEKFSTSCAGARTARPLERESAKKSVGIKFNVDFLLDVI
jgi:hypothetical protein